jgi:hypothetical protein
MACFVICDKSGSSLESWTTSAPRIEAAESSEDYRNQDCRDHASSEQQGARSTQCVEGEQGQGDRRDVSRHRRHAAAGRDGGPSAA